MTDSIRCALLSVSDKAHLAELAAALVAQNVKILSTGGSAKALRDAGIKVTDVSEYTQSPEVMDGRVKTLHPRIHGGILARPIESDLKQLEEIGGHPIDLVVVNLYPFESTVAKGADYATCVENIDIGGPCMVRAAAKNHQRVSIVVDPSDYAMVIGSLPAGPSQEQRAKLAAKAFAHTAHYDGMIASWLGTESKSELLTPLKYGCNPQQIPASIGGIGGAPLPFEVLNGKPGYVSAFSRAHGLLLACCSHSWVLPGCPRAFPSSGWLLASAVLGARRQCTTPARLLPNALRQRRHGATGVASRPRTRAHLRLLWTPSSRFCSTLTTS